MNLTWEDREAMCDECGGRFKSINLLLFGTDYCVVQCCQECLVDLKDLILRESKDTVETDDLE